MSKQEWIAEHIQDGEQYAGIILGKGDEPDHHVFLLPWEATSVKWGAAVELAKKAGGELPTRREQALLYANLKDQFKPNYYWSCEQHAANSDYAWIQYFDDGCQDYYDKSYEGRARAVRRLTIL